MFQLIRITDKAGNPSQKFGVQYIGGTIFNCSTVEEVMEAKFLVINHPDWVRGIFTEPIEQVRVQTSLWGPELIEVHTAESIYFLETTIPEGTAILDGCN